MREGDVQLVKVLDHFVMDALGGSESGWWCESKGVVGGSDLNICALAPGRAIKSGNGVLGGARAVSIK